MNQVARTTTAEAEIELGSLSGSLGFLLRLAQVRVFDAFFEDLAGEGIKPGEFTLLWVLSLNGSLAQGSLARVLSIKPAHMTKLVSRLVKAGLVQRAPSREDRRVVDLSLTPEGTDFVARHKPAFMAFHTRERDLLSPEDFDALTGLLRRFTGLEKEDTCR
ncbi:MarR family winged helix-turn-helix transcriptional regulator [Mesobacterium pallidum]|uniref:MarR family winged helix-turn-helix transcriptional regulator n=1 Tax=Mesobacterium pallidum TaxID=2872037 RepID=UPI001EE23DCC|nr:MarR family transcriptional regulator [Mesobacterium pallidum]